MNWRASLALMMVATMISPAVAGFTIYAPGSGVTPIAPGAFGVPSASVVVPLYMVGTGFTMTCDTQVQFDTSALQIVNLDTDVSPGLINSTWSVSAYAPGTPGVVNIAGFGEDGITNPSGSVLNIRFQILPTAPAGPWNIGLAAFDSTHFTYVSGHIATAFPGDADLNGTVNGADLNIVLSDYNQAFDISACSYAAWTKGDFDQNGLVNGADLNVVLSNYNMIAPGVAATPEPGTLGMLALAIVARLAWKGWRRQR
jgi:hypothetical protein